MTSQEITRLLPYLRRYARALTGAQGAGDSVVRACLEAIAAGRLEPNPSLPPKTALFQVFHTVWRETLSDRSIENGVGATAKGWDGALRAMLPEHRTALLLVTLEGLSMREAATVLQITEHAAERRYAAAEAAICAQKMIDVLIVEDEPVVALDLDRLVRDMGHRVGGVASTRTEARVLADQVRPGLVLADVRLADGSSGLHAAQDILAAFDIPVIFITASPEQLLTGEGEEPAFLVTKPFQDGAVRAVIGQALLFSQTSHASWAAQ